jgi:alpha-1,2-mannosyltransferase
MPFYIPIILQKLDVAATGRPFFQKIMIMVTSSSIFPGLIALFFFLFRFRSLYSASRRDQQNRRPKKIIYAFFHPYASGGGGGERVLWKIIQFLQLLSQKGQHRQLRLRQQQQQQQQKQNNKKEDDDDNKDDDDDDDDDVVEIVIYSIDPPSTDEADLRLDAEQRFDVKIPFPVSLVSLEEYKEYLSPRPFLSLVMESWGTMKLARQAILLMKKQQQQSESESESEFIFCDTTGYAFTFAVVRWMCSSTTTRILAYVHYPTISTDMMLWEWRKNSNNNDIISVSIKRRIKTVIKLIYYYLFSLIYGLCGSLADLVLVNSTWTYNHINSLWRFGSGGGAGSQKQPIRIVYPPCRVPNSVDDNNNDIIRENTIISIGQFRPEKNHKLQIQALSMVLKKHSELRKMTPKTKTTTKIIIQSSPIISTSGDVKLLLIGSCRNDADQGRVDDLRRLVKELHLQDHVIFSINPPYHELQSSMMKASIGIHTMRQEHFGIGIVEMMAAGLLTIAHNSGGPKTDIILEVDDDDPKDIDKNEIIVGTGFLATTIEEYADAIFKGLTMDVKDSQNMRRNAQASATRFSDDAFDKSLEQVLPLLYS